MGYTRVPPTYAWICEVPLRVGLKLNNRCSVNASHVQELRYGNISSVLMLLVSIYYHMFLSHTCFGWRCTSHALCVSSFLIFHVGIEIEPLRALHLRAIERTLYVPLWARGALEFTNRSKYSLVHRNKYRLSPHQYKYRLSLMGGVIGRGILVITDTSDDFHITSISTSFHLCLIVSHCLRFTRADQGVYTFRCVTINYYFPVILTRDAPCVPLSTMCAQVRCVHKYKTWYYLSTICVLELWF